jgi:acetoacetyl-CoA synthetase
MAEILWSPSQEWVAETHLRRFMDGLPHRFGGYHELWEWSVTHRDEFWRAVWDYTGVIASRPPDRPIGVEAMPGTEWFPGARLNFAENLLRHRGADPALIAAAEDGTSVAISRDDLAGRVARIQTSLRTLGVGPGDRVAGLVANTPEPIIAMLAAASIGAIWSSCSPDFGPMGVVDRFGQIEPKVLIAVDGYRYNGRPFSVAETVSAAVERIPSIEQVVVVDTIGGELDLPVPTIPWRDAEAGDDLEPDFAPLPFDHPLVVMYSSGTTGPPKSIVHGAGGTLLKHLCGHQLLFDVHPGDRMFWFTTCGWMMWNWIVSSLASGAAVVLYDGSPSHPDLGTLWRLAEQAGITHFGASPRYLAANANAAIVPREIADLSAIRVVGSTGAPLGPEQFDWVYENVGDDLLLSSITGGTDLIGVFAGGVPILPVRRGEITARWPGMAVEAWDPAGRPLVGDTGELVCVAPFPSMPVSFWCDPDGRKYHEAYFERYPGVWTHGDFIEIRPEGGVVVYGRSDTTLNPSGVRIGTAEIYHVIETMPEIDDSIVVGRDVPGDVEVVLFVKPAAGVRLDEDLIERIRRRIRDEATPRHVPAHVLEVDAVPYTISGKKVEKAVRNILAGEEVDNRDALANPESLEQYAARFRGM